MTPTESDPVAELHRLAQLEEDGRRITGDDLLDVAAMIERDYIRNDNELHQKICCGYGVDCREAGAVEATDASGGDTNSAAPAPTGIPALCVWTEDEDGFWGTTCGQTHGFTNGGPRENGAHYCCYCGLALSSRKFVEPVELADDEADASPEILAARLNGMKTLELLLATATDEQIQKSLNKRGDGKPMTVYDIERAIVRELCRIVVEAWETTRKEPT